MRILGPGLEQGDGDGRGGRKQIRGVMGAVSGTLDKVWGGGSELRGMTPLGFQNTLQTGE